MRSKRVTGETTAPRYPEEPQSSPTLVEILNPKAPGAADLIPLAVEFALTQHAAVAFLLECNGQNVAPAELIKNLVERYLNAREPR